MEKITVDFTADEDQTTVDLKKIMIKVRLDSETTSIHIQYMLNFKLQSTVIYYVS